MDRPQPLEPGCETRAPDSGTSLISWVTRCWTFRQRYCSFKSLAVDSSTRPLSTRSTNEMSWPALSIAGKFSSTSEGGKWTKQGGCHIISWQGLNAKQAEPKQILKRTDTNTITCNPHQYMFFFTYFGQMTAVWLQRILFKPSPMGAVVWMFLPNM